MHAHVAVPAKSTREHTGWVLPFRYSIALVGEDHDTGSGDRQTATSTSPSADRGKSRTLITMTMRVRFHLYARMQKAVWTNLAMAAVPDLPHSPC